MKDPARGVSPSPARLMRRRLGSCRPPWPDTAPRRRPRAACPPWTPGRRRDADADGHRDRALVGGHGDAGHPRAHALEEAHISTVRDARRDQQELLPAVAADAVVACAIAPARTAVKPLQDLVTRLMTVGVVDRLEMVHVAHAHRETRHPAARARESSSASRSRMARRLRIPVRGSRIASCASAAWTESR